MKHFLGCDSQEVRIGKKETKLFMLLLKAKVTLLILLSSKTSLMEHIVLQPTKCIFFTKTNWTSKIIFSLNLSSLDHESNFFYFLFFYSQFSI